MQPQIDSVAGEGGARGVGADTDHGVGRPGLQDLHLAPHARAERRAARVGGLARDRLSVPCQRISHSGPAAAPIRVDLIEDRHSPASDSDEIVDEPGRLLPVGGPQVEGELTVGRFALRLRSREGEEEVDLLVAESFQQRQHPGDGRGTYVPEEQEDALVLHEPDGVRDARIGLISVVVELEDDPAAVHSSIVIDVVEIGHRAAIQLRAQAARGARERGGYAEHDFTVLRDSFAAAPVSRQRGSGQRLRPGNGGQRGEPGAQERSARQQV